MANTYSSLCSRGICRLGRGECLGLRCSLLGIALYLGRVHGRYFFTEIGN
jgi:hypothetical protein